MALLWTDGFDNADNKIYLQKYLAVGSTKFPASVTGRLGGLAREFTKSGNIVFKESFLTRYKVNLAVPEIICGAGFSIRGTLGEWRLFSFYLGAAYQGALIATVQADTNYVRFRVVDANNNTLESETGDFPTANFTFFPAAAWYYIEFKYLFDVAAGAFEVRINGVPEITSSIAYNTDPNAIGACDRVGSESPLTGNTSGPSIYLDDLYIADTSGGLLNDFLAVDAGGVEVNTLQVNALGALQQWEDVEDYNNARTRIVRLGDLGNAEGIVIEGGVAERELYEFDALPTINQQVLAVQFGLCGFRHQGEGAVQVRGIYRQPSDGQIGTGNSVALGAYREMYRKVIFDSNPVDATLFDLTEINDGQFGIEVA